MIFDLGILVPISISGEEYPLYTVRRRQARAGSASDGVLVRHAEPDANKKKESTTFTVDQMVTYRRLGIKCNNGGGTGGDDDDGSTGTGGDDDDGTQMVGGYSGGSRHRHSRFRRTAMRAFRAGECICDDELGICWTYGDPYDDHYCCVPDEVSPVAPPVTAPVGPPVEIPTAAPVNLAPPTPENELSNDTPTIHPGVL